MNFGGVRWNFVDFQSSFIEVHANFEEFQYLSAKFDFDSDSDSDRFNDSDSDRFSESDSDSFSDNYCNSDSDSFDQVR